MTMEALKFSNKIIITDDNPRNEDPRKIRKEMISKIPKKNLVKIKEIAKKIQFNIVSIFWKKMTFY